MMMKFKTAKETIKVCNQEYYMLKNEPRFANTARKAPNAQPSK